MPLPNPWLTDPSSSPSSKNAGWTEVARSPGPKGGRKLDHDHVKAVPVLFVSNPLVKNVGSDVVVLAPDRLGIEKILATDGNFDLIDFLPYPGFESRALQTDDRAIAAALREVDAARRANDDAELAAIPESLSKLGLDFKTGVRGTSLIDKDGFHYCVYGSVHLLKSTDDNKARGRMQVVRSVNVTDGLPPDIAARITRIIGCAMTYDGFLVIVAPGALLALDRDLNVQSSVSFRGETINTSIAVDEKGGIYVVTSARMMKMIWNGRRLSTDSRDGAWESPYNSTISSDKTHSYGATSCGSGTPPTLMGFGTDRDKLVVIADADERGPNAVAFWRDDIPSDFKQRPGTKSRRIADHIRIEISRGTVESPPAVSGYGIAFQNSNYPKPAKLRGIGNAFISGVTRPAPMGIQKFTWNPEKHEFEKAWINYEIDNTDWVVPSISAFTNEMYVAHKHHGNYQYVGLDWQTGIIKDRWAFPDDSRAWNAFGGITKILDNGDLMVGGVFAIKRLRIGGPKVAA